MQAIEAYLKAAQMLRNFSDEAQDPVFTLVVSLDLSTVVSCVSGPKRPHDRVSVTDMKSDFMHCLTNKVNLSEAMSYLNPQYQLEYVYTSGNCEKTHHSPNTVHFICW